ncbi:hypothetical protein bcgnr5378_28920 [Bacillus cereus]
MKTKQSALYVIPKATYYDTKTSVIENAANLHRSILEEDRELYTYLLYFQEATYYSKSMIIRSLLSNSLHLPQNKEVMQQDPKRLEIENRLILRALYNESMTHALKMLLSLHDVNNSRTSKLVLQFLFQRQNLDRIAIKYKQKIKKLLVQSLGSSNMYNILNETDKGTKLFTKWISPYKNHMAKDIISFVFGGEGTKDSSYIRQYQEAKNFFQKGEGKLEKSDVPFEVLLGFNNFYKRGATVTSLIVQGNTSDKQRIQMQRAVRKESNDEIQLKIDFSKYKLMDLAKYIYSNVDTDISDATQMLDKKVEEMRATLPPFFDNDFALITDLSDSHLGSSETPLHPMYKNVLLTNLLKQQDAYRVGGIEEQGLIKPCGDTNISSAVIQAAKDGHKNIIILSDGYENVGDVNAVVKRLKELNLIENVLHLNPVFSPKNLSFKDFGEEIVSLPIFDVESVGELEIYHLLNTDEKEFKVRMREIIETELFPISI